MSNIESFQNQIHSLITSLVIGPLCEWLSREKHVHVTVDELHDVLKLPKNIRTIPVSTLTTSTPVASSSKTRVTKPPSKEKKIQKEDSKEKGVEESESKSEDKGENVLDKTCKYVFKRGELKGKECGKLLKTADSEYCEQCSNKKTNKPSDMKQTKITETKTTTTTTTTGFTAPLVTKKVEKPKIELREIGSQPNTYLDTQTNIVVKKVVEKDKVFYVAVGVQEESGFRTLREEEKKEALSRNFTLQNSGKTEAEEEGGKIEIKDKKIMSRKPVNNIPDIDDE
jgi:hypothetical protein